MMIRSLGERRDPVGELQGHREIGEREGALQPQNPLLIDEAPGGDLGGEGVALPGGQPGNVTAAGDALHVDESHHPPILPRYHGSMTPRPPVDFESAVIQRSREIPVVVDFMADWCAPCRVLGPLLVRLAAESKGRWELVVIDTEAQPELARDSGIASLPTVMMFRQGREVSAFGGSLPRDEVERWLKTQLPDPREDLLASIAAKWEAVGSGIRDELERFVAAHPDYAPARLLLAQSVVGEDPARARGLVEGAGGDIEALGQDVTSLADLVELPGNLPERLAGPLGAAREAFLRHDLDAALGHLVDAAMVDFRFFDELPRRGAVALMRILGHDHEISRRYERRLSMALHA